ncbi:Hypothetical protein R9X50_00069500 [Acrodontium crateriforme]|uniref:PIN domain-containing protein n=1 Tax=Acrodontium crateriforme TaxID=150365 RepID=A0AAQ3R9D6_9PEZI|nr:Hypothetical protein R9X50_00069500 [Acrodontium crateriforme]
MRGNRSRPSSRPTSQHGALQPARKVFNCIIDDTALVAGVKKSTRNGIRQWVKNGQIRLFVPLHALEELSKQKASNNRHAEDVQETLQWLDDATSKYPHAITLQGGDQFYSTWAEVEQFAVPRSLFSENDHLEADASFEEDDLVESTHGLAVSGRPKSSSSASEISQSPCSPQSLRSSSNSPLTSPSKPMSSPFKSNPASKARPIASGASVPAKLQSLFNYILWRVHQELDPAAALESFIFLCNDPNKVNYAKGFDVRYKRLEQLREVVSREDRDFKNRQLLLNRENESAKDDDQVLFKAPRGPAAMAASNVIDPNAFDRGTSVSDLPKSPRLSQAQIRGGGPPRSPRANGRGRGRGNNLTQTAPAQTTSQIDPDSFSRPRGVGHAGRGGRKLWVPT